MRKILLVIAIFSGLLIPQAAEAAPSEHKRVVGYWTKARRDAAVPQNIERRGKAGPGLGSNTSGATWTAGGDAAKTTGKVFFTQGGVNYVCSGSAVDSPAGNLVLTAGHCVHQGSGGAFSTNFIFYPGYASGPNPALGSWTANRLYTTGNWAGTTDGFDDDAGFAVVNGNLEGTLTANGATAPTIAFNSPSETDQYFALGYPAAGKYKGQKLIYCAGQVRIAYDGNQTLALPCNMTGGSSGGPWLVEYDTGARVIESLNSYGYSSIRNTMFGPIFGAQEQSAYLAASTGVGGVHN